MATRRHQPVECTCQCAVAYFEAPTPRVFIRGTLQQQHAGATTTEANTYTRFVKIMNVRSSAPGAPTVYIIMKASVGFLNKQFSLTA